MLCTYMEEVEAHFSYCYHNSCDDIYSLPDAVIDPTQTKEALEQPVDTKIRLHV